MVSRTAPPRPTRTPASLALARTGFSSLSGHSHTARRQSRIWPTQPMPVSSRIAPAMEPTVPAFWTRLWMSSWSEMPGTWSAILCWSVLLLGLLSSGGADRRGDGEQREEREEADEGHRRGQPRPLHPVQALVRSPCVRGHEAHDPGPDAGKLFQPVHDPTLPCSTRLTRKSPGSGTPKARDTPRRGGAEGYQSATASTYRATQARAMTARARSRRTTSSGSPAEPPSAKTA